MELNFFKYNIPFKGNFKTSNNTFHSRKGVIIRLKKGNITALGEASPLPGFSKETIENVTDQIRENRPNILAFFKSDFSLKSLNDFLIQSSFLPSLQFSLFTLGIFYLAQKNEQPPQNFLFDNGNDSVKMNAVIDLKKRSLLPQARQYINREFETIKIKVDNNWDEVFPQIQKIRDEYEDIAIRLDANRSWRADDAVERLKKAEELEIEYCEEPIKNITLEKMRQLKKETSVPIALDESLLNWSNSKKAASLADVFIIKPMLWGSYTKINKICNFATAYRADGCFCRPHGSKAVAIACDPQKTAVSPREPNKKVVFTSTLGTAIERLATATLASGLGSTNQAHGINTGHFLADDVWDDTSSINNGCYKLPDCGRLKNLMQSELKHLNLQAV